MDARQLQQQMTMMMMMMIMTVMMIYCESHESDQPQRSQLEIRVSQVLSVGELFTASVYKENKTSHRSTLQPRAVVC